MAAKVKYAPVRTIGGMVVEKVAGMTEPNSMILYGRQKMGKSTLAASIIEVPGYEKVLHIDVDKGATAFARQYPDVDVVTPEHGDAGAISEVLTEIAESPDGLGYRAVIIDTFSILSEWALDQIAGGKKPEFDHWAAFKDWATATMWELHRMKPLGIALFHEQTRENAITHEKLKSAKIQGSAASVIGAIPDLIGYLAIAESRTSITRTLRLHPGEQIDAGNRFPGLPEEKLADPTMADLFSFIRGEDNYHVAPPSLLERFEASAGAEAPIE